MAKDRTLTEDERQIVVNAMFAAARLYDESARTSRQGAKNNPGLESLAKQFDKQAAETREFAGKIEDASDVILKA